MQTISLLFKVLWSPSEAMFLVSKSPRIVAPILFVCLFSFVGGNLVSMKLDPTELAVKAIERSARGSTVSDEQKEELRNLMNSPVFKGIRFASTLVLPLFLIALAAVIYFALFSALGREANFKVFLSITAFAFIPLIFRQLAAVFTAFIVPASAVIPDELGSIGPAVFLNLDSISPTLFAAVNMVDVVTIWILALLTIGYGFAARKTLSKWTRVSAVLGVFVLYAVLRLAVAAVRGA